MSTEISIVVPVLNEEESLRPLWAALHPVLEKLGRTWEVLLCDDGSNDRSVEIMKELAASEPRIKIIVFRRNFGQSAAMAAGFDHAKGDVLIPMDADLQNDPEDIPRLLAEMEDKDLDVVKGWRHQRQDAYWTKTLPSRIANRLISRVTGVQLHDYGCTLTAYRAEIAKDIHIYGEMHRFLPAFAHWAGGRIGELKVNHRAREWGVSKYNLSKTFRVILDILTVRFLVGYSTKPLYFFGRWGFLFLFLGGAAATWTIIKKLVWKAALYTDPFFLAAIFCGITGIQILLIGLIAELNIRIYYESQHKPPYHVRETMNVSSD
jgi:glycosyltransferase involved in cell wall biosynthesis